MIRVFVLHGHGLPCASRASIEYPTLNAIQFIRIETTTLNFFEPRILEDFSGRDSSIGIGVQQSIHQSLLKRFEAFEWNIMRHRIVGIAFDCSGSLIDW